MIYLYDGTFDGFLTCVHEHYHSGKADGIYPPGVYQPDMLTTSRETPSDADKASKVEAAIEERISPYVLARVYRVFRTETPGKEMALLNYIRFCFKHGPGAAFMHSHPFVHPVVVAEQKIGNEVHRLCGLVRFSTVAPAGEGSRSGSGESPADAGQHTGAGESPGGARESRAVAPAGPAGGGAPKEILYSRISPDHEVLEFLAPHFTDRFRNDPFIIHDTKRGKALVAWRGKWHIADFTSRDAALLGNTEGEDAYREMWRGYFDTIAIRERTNPRCQRNLMPARYWQNLPEMQLR
jgi:hypothetical protein